MLRLGFIVKSSLYKGRLQLLDQMMEENASA